MIYKNIQIEIILMTKQPDKKTDTIEEQTINQFLDKWTGFLKGADTNDSKRQYLSEKYK